MNDLSLTWKNYFKDFHEGMGTTYERFVLHGIFEKIRNEFGVETVLEGPVLGITGISGINSMGWPRMTLRQRWLTAMRSGCN
jgi:hypothetical protein